MLLSGKDVSCFVLYGLNPCLWTRSQDALERMARVDTITFDKTGTLTQGRIAVSDCLSLNGPEGPGDRGADRPR